MKQWTVITPDADFAGLKLEDVPVPSVGDYDALVRFHTTSLDYRTFPFAHRYPIVPNSDSAREVVDVGAKTHQYGDINPNAASSGVGGVFDGALRQFGVFPEAGLVKVPSNLDHTAACTLPCAALTSWNALYGLKPVKAGQIVLVAQFAKAAGATIITTTSSAEKEKVLKDLDANHTEGVNHIIDVGGQNSLEQSLECIKMDGIINVVGFLGASVHPRPTLLDALSHICTVRGVYVGIRAMLKDMVRANEATGLDPVVDQKIFEPVDAKHAFQYMTAQNTLERLF
ncbi:hypothetical protein BJY00DRAFT_301709 [Aspergillus carlsbadensis]|nr:hypothetical protein BJY00DRAFT_301709 [Aspergillus carlsbadensis]